MRYTTQPIRFILELGISVLVLWVADPENRLLFLLVLGTLSAITAFIAIARASKTNVGGRIALWAVLIAGLAFLRFQIWRPRTQTPSLDRTVLEFIFPSLAVIAIASIVGAIVGRLLILIKLNANRNSG